MCSNGELDPCGEDMIPLSFHTVKPDGQAQIVPNQSVKASYATATSYSTDLQIQCSHCSTDPVPVVTIDEEANNEPPSKKRKLSITVTLKKSLWVRNSVMLILTWPKDYLGYSSLIGWLTIYSVTTKKAPIPERKEKMLQIVHSGSCHHWIVATTIGNKRDAGEVLVYGFIFKNVDRETRKNICNIFQLLPISNVKVVKTLK